MARGLEIKPPEIEREPNIEVNANVTYVVTSILVRGRDGSVVDRIYNYTFVNIAWQYW